MTQVSFMWEFLWRLVAVAVEEVDGRDLAPLFLEPEEQNEYMFIKKRMKLSVFIQNTFSFKTTFIHCTISSKIIFIQKTFSNLKYLNTRTQNTQTPNLQPLNPKPWIPTTQKT